MTILNYLDSLPFWKEILVFLLLFWGGMLGVLGGLWWKEKRY